jgi:hypothetical protein
MNGINDFHPVIIYALSRRGPHAAGRPNALADYWPAPIMVAWW